MTRYWLIAAHPLAHISPQIFGANVGVLCGPSGPPRRPFWASVDLNDRSGKNVIYVTAMCCDLVLCMCDLSHMSEGALRTPLYIVGGFYQGQLPRQRCP